LIQRSAPTQTELVSVTKKPLFICGNNEFMVGNRVTPGGPRRGELGCAAPQAGVEKRVVPGPGLTMAAKSRRSELFVTIAAFWLFTFSRSRARVAGTLQDTCFWKRC